MFSPPFGGLGGFKDCCIPDELYYSDDHLWSRLETDEKMIIGLTDVGQRIAGSMRFLRIRRKGTDIHKGQFFGMFNGAKVWVGPFKSPISGAIAEVNNSVLDDPTLVNSDPYGKGWLISLTAYNLEEEIKSLHSTEDWTGLIEETIEERKRKAWFHW